MMHHKQFKGGTAICHEVSLQMQGCSADSIQNLHP